MKRFIKSTVIVTILSSIIGLAIMNIGGNFLTTFLLAFSCQYILFSFVANIINSYIKQQTIQKELDVLEPLSTILECSYCNQKNLMIFNPDDIETSEFSCSECQKKNSVKIQFVVARQTEFIQLPMSSKGVSLKDKEIIDIEDKNYE
jgi:hypothetical protein